MSTISTVMSIAENTSIPVILKISLTSSLSQAYLDICLDMIAICVFGEGFAESIPSSFDDLGLYPDEIQYSGKIDDYLREKEVMDLEYRSDLNRWTFGPLVNDL